MPAPETAAAPPTTLLGQLQRGLGRGRLTVLRERVGAEEVRRCLQENPLGDLNRDGRGAYFADLVEAVGIAVPELAALLRDRELDSPSGQLLVDVLTELSSRGWADAQGARLADPRIAAAEARRDSPSTPTPPAPAPHAGMTTAELLAHARRHASLDVRRLLAQRTDALSVALLLDAARTAQRGARVIALYALGEQGHLGLRDEIAAALEAGPRSPNWLLIARAHHLALLPRAETLGLARGWLAHAQANARWAGARILAKHAEPADRAAVEARLTLIADHRPDLNGASFLVQALERIGDRRSAKCLEDVFARTLLDSVRGRALEALIELDAPAGEVLAREALWDAEWGVRWVGVEATPLTEETRARLGEIGGDEREDRDVRRAAKTRLI